MPTIVQNEQHAVDPLAYQGTDVFDWIEATGPGAYRTKRYLLFTLTPDTALFIPPGWTFDGASGPAIDGVGNMLAALVHDALYGMIEEKRCLYTYGQADALYRRICIAQGAGRPRAWLHWSTLRAFGWIHRLAN
jgi:hypothetical protein